MTGLTKPKNRISAEVQGQFTVDWKIFINIRQGVNNMTQSYIRKAVESDLCRIAETEIFNYRLNFYPIFRNDEYYFDELQVTDYMRSYDLQNLYVYDDGAVKGFTEICGKEIKKLFVEPVLQGNGRGEKLLEFAVSEKQATFLWALEKNFRAIKFYTKHGFKLTDGRKYEDGTTEYLVKMELQDR